MMSAQSAVYIGIDPGKSGGIAALTEDGQVFMCEKLPATERDVIQTLEGAVTCADFGFIERVSSSPQMGVKSAFTFGQSYGFLRGCLFAAGVAFDDITPAKWQRALGCLSKGDKNVTKAKAQQLFPGVKITHAIADALLIAEYGRRLRTGTL